MIPHEKDLVLVEAVANALCDYHQEKRGDFACWSQAASLLIRSELLANKGYSVDDFFITTHYVPGAAR